MHPFVNSFVDNEQKRADSYQLIELMSQWSGFEPRMWGPAIIGFGSYHYKYTSGHEGDAPLIGFSPRKAAFSLYVSVLGHDNKNLLSELGKYKMGKACIYVQKLSDLNIETLERLSKATIEYITKNQSPVQNR
ncbi:hypothetical protein GCM10023187_09910 [Nibrella viscosa]|uniref:YdhG-like domain-containing protein n=1 Tax=Nibrella viscosa TaxID=1084524 RepID=A0ABP8K0E7_9BACT